jgi:hypothetical protein
MSALFPDAKAERIVYGAISFAVVLIFLPAAIGFTTIYPVHTPMLRLLKSLTGTALVLLVQVAALVWVWCVFRARWAQRWFNALKNELVLAMVALPILVAMWFISGMN